MITTFHVFYAFTGCDIVSSFGGKGKNTNWAVLPRSYNVWALFKNLLLLQDRISDQTMSTLFVVLIYDRTSDTIKFNDCRKQLFTRKSRILDNLPPTKAALQQHVKRGTYQAICGTKALNGDPKLPSPENWGWEKNYVTGWPDCQKHHSHAMN